ncbi:MAG: efflux RND transporter periplasmic adaptor subunit [Phycisphaerales bacterium]|nr:MAG: efflux RND transporter periplasmic adaptor subunit [Phycisphaerales bacterium]
MAEQSSKIARLIVSALLIIVLLVGGGSVAYVLIKTKPEPPRSETRILPPLVDSLVVEADSVTERFVGYGTALPDRSATLSAEVPARIVEVVNDIEAGSAIAEDQVLIRLDDRQYQQELERALALAEADDAQLREIGVEKTKLRQLIQIAKTELEIASDEKKRVTRLFEEGHAEKREFDLVRLAYQRARRTVQDLEKDYDKLEPQADRVAASKKANEAQAATARLNVERCTIKAPFAGTIDQLMVDVGDHATIGIPLLTLVDSSHIEIPIQLPASAYDRVRRGAPSRIAAESMPNRSWSGEVARIAPLAQQQTRTFAVYIDVDNTKQERPLLPGMFVRALVSGPTHPQALVIPRGAIRRGHIFVVEGDVARRRAVTIERFLLDQALVGGEIQSGDRVILSHMDQLADGMKVRVRPGDAQPQTASLPPAGAEEESSP